jgi:hypothetical protein
LEADVPAMKLGVHSAAIGLVCRALEAAAGVPQGSGGDVAWIRNMLVLVNRKNRTDITYGGEDYGYVFTYHSPASAELLGNIKRRYRL